MPIFSIFTSQDQEISHFQIPEQEIEHEAKWHCLVCLYLTPCTECDHRISVAILKLRGLISMRPSFH